MPNGFVDPYIDPDTGILRNLVGAKSYLELSNAEGELVAARTNELLSCSPFVPVGALEDFCKIHAFLFQDIYEWAGRPRTVEIRKNVEGSEFFLPSCNIGMGFAWAKGELDKDQCLHSMDRAQFVERLAYHFDNYNFIHPFREGNGRVQRLFWTLLCHSAGYDLDWRRVSGEENDEASRLAAEKTDLSGLVEMFDKIASLCNASAPINAGLLPPGHLS